MRYLTLTNAVAVDFVHLIKWIGLVFVVSKLIFFDGKMLWHWQNVSQTQHNLALVDLLCWNSPLPEMLPNPGQQKKKEKEIQSLWLCCLIFICLPLLITGHISQNICFLVSVLIVLFFFIDWIKMTLGSMFYVLVQTTATTTNRVRENKNTSIEVLTLIVRELFCLFWAAGDGVGVGCTWCTWWWWWREWVCSKHSFVSPKKMSHKGLQNQAEKQAGQLSVLIRLLPTTPAFLSAHSVVSSISFNWISKLFPYDPGGVYYISIWGKTCKLNHSIDGFG